ncbi:hypothetical protein HDV05_003199 [Chytridiales sp. JEL 0842]|nr:hypothetical protein HDV05_003199 [Chytridiales sp. JEL 0842]
MVLSTRFEGVFHIAEFRGVDRITRFLSGGTIREFLPFKYTSLPDSGDMEASASSSSAGFFDDDDEYLNDLITKHNISESSIQLVVEILALEREDAVSLLVTYGGDSEAVIANAFG